MTRLDELREEVDALITAFVEAPNPPMMCGPAAEGEDEKGVPPSMQVGPVDASGWVTWRTLPSTVTRDALDALDAALGLSTPLQVKAYLAARCHLFDQLHSTRFGEAQLVMLPAFPPSRPLAEFRGLALGWGALLRANYLPVAEWGDGWGPVCVDMQAATEEDGPLVWFDHEVILPLGEDAIAQRERVCEHAQPLHESFRAFLEDLFTPYAP